MNSEKIRKIQKLSRAILLPPSLVYGGVVNIKNFLYNKKILRAQTYNNVKIIGVGNIAAGGVGKTPVVIELCRALSQYGKVCAITGSYPTKDKRVNIVSLDGKIFKKPDVIPDEAYMIAKKAKVSVISSKNRKAAIELAIGLKTDYIVLDDALHKRSIKKNTEICVVDKEKPLEDGFYLPAGMLRDSKSSIKRCDITICLNKTGFKEKKIDCYEASFKPAGIFNNKKEKIDNVKTAFLFCGIGKPESFYKSVKNLGIKINGHKFFEDHHIYSKKDMQSLYEMQNKTQAEILLTTYKDYVKIENEDVCYLDVSLDIEKFDEVIEKLK